MGIHLQLPAIQYRNVLLGFNRYPIVILEYDSLRHLSVKIQAVHCESHGDEGQRIGQCICQRYCRMYAFQKKVYWLPSLSTGQSSCPFRNKELLALAKWVSITSRWSPGPPFLHWVCRKYDVYPIHTYIPMSGNDVHGFREELLARESGGIKWSKQYESRPQTWSNCPGLCSESYSLTVAQTRIGGVFFSSKTSCLEASRMLGCWLNPSRSFWLFMDFFLELSQTQRLRFQLPQFRLPYRAFLHLWMHRYLLRLLFHQNKHGVPQKSSVQEL